MFKSGYIFTPFEAPEQSPFERLFDIFSELITHTSGDVDEALDWLNILDKEYSLTNHEYTMDDFIEDLKKYQNFESFNLQIPNFTTDVSKMQEFVRKRICKNNLS